MDTIESYRAPDDLLKDRIIAVTGAGDGIGRCMANAFAARGATVILLGRTVAKLESIYDEIEQAGYPQAAIFPMNFANSSEEHYQNLQ
ncbi:MAG: short-subunit dehydrogenase, partial [Cellvibrionaceae bacterium]